MPNTCQFIYCQCHKIQNFFNINEAHHQFSWNSWIMSPLVSINTPGTPTSFSFKCSNPQVASFGLCQWFAFTSKILYIQPYWASDPSSPTNSNQCDVPSCESSRKCWVFCTEASWCHPCGPWGPPWGPPYRPWGQRQMNGGHVEPPRKDFNFSPSTAAPTPPAISVVALAPSRASGFKFSQLHLLGLLSNHANDFPHLHLLQISLQFLGSWKIRTQAQKLRPARWVLAPMRSAASWGQMVRGKNTEPKCLNLKMPNAKYMSIYSLYKSINVTKSKI